MDERRINAVLEGAIIKLIQSGEVFKIPYDNKIDISDELKAAVLKINYDRLSSKITELIEDELAQKIVNKIVTEMGNDIKKLMENPTVRDDFRFMLRKNVETILEKVRE